jgi:hypothetical protein
VVRSNVSITDGFVAGVVLASWFIAGLPYAVHASRNVIDVRLLISATFSTETCGCPWEVSALLLARASTVRLQLSPQRNVASTSAKPIQLRPAAIALVGPTSIASINGSTAADAAAEKT